MSREHGGSARKSAEVRPIYRRGDRVLAELPSGFYELVVQSSEIVDGELWLYGKGVGFGTSFPARCIVGRLRPGEGFTWPMSK